MSVISMCHRVLGRPCVRGGFDTEMGFEGYPTREQGEMGSVLLFSHCGVETGPVEGHSWRAAGLWDISTPNLQQAWWHRASSLNDKVLLGFCGSLGYLGRAYSSRENISLGRNSN